MDPELSAAAPGIPRWVKAFVLIGILVAALVVVVLLVSRGDHGPGRHAPTGQPEGAPEDNDTHRPADHSTPPRQETAASRKPPFLQGDAP